jgi:hypothetical protein
MTAWLRRKNVPVQPLAEDRKRLVHSYMDADEETARRQAIEERERESQARARVRAVPNENRARLDAESAGKTQGKAAGESGLGADDFADAVLREAAKQAARQVAAAEEQGRRLAAEEVARRVAAAEEHARRAADEEVEMRVAAAVEKARKEISRQAAEETTRQVAAAAERARRLAVEAAAQQGAAAHERARAEAAEETARQVAAAERRVRAQVAAEAARQAAIARPEHPDTHDQAAEPNDAALPVETVASEPAAQGQSQAAAEVLHDASGVSASGEEFQEPAEKAPEEASPPASDHAREDSPDGLPVYEWVHAATRFDDEGDAPDWTRDLLRIRERTQTDDLG